ncbi:MAG: CocE/NonD family hydrolase [Kiloniellales bacterium]
MKLVTRFPRAVKEIENLFIPLKDGTRLAARIWLPEDAEADPVPAILEYLPYRKRDGTAERDALTHPYFAGHGYAGVRVDMRGSGDSDGVLLGEYLKQEQDDALEVIAWLADQPWCSGRVGMIGISWGGFNGLQVAARRPPALKAVISLCSTDDRYADDIHFMGGCLLVDKLSWGSTMLAINATPPDPALVGERWRELWLERLEKSGLWIEEWHRRQRRDAFYEHGSVCEDYEAIECPVYMVGGWADGYTNAIFRTLEHLKVPCKGLVGPWAHKYPHFANPGPRIGFLQEALRWWDKWLKDKETGIMEEPRLRAWIQDSVHPATWYAERPGRWVAEDGWPSACIVPQRVALSADVLHLDGRGGTGEVLSICSPQSVGGSAGKWCAYGLGRDQPGDQRDEAGGSLVFDSAPLAEPLEILGAPIAELALASDRPVAFVAAVLSEVLPDGAATRVSYGLLNLTHREGHETPKPLEPGRRYSVAVKLNYCGHRFAPGSRVRVALSTSYWPIVWPAPEKATLQIVTGESAFLLPLRPPRAEDETLAPFAESEGAEPLHQTVLRAGSSAMRRTTDLATGEIVAERYDDDGLRRLDDIDWEVEVTALRRYAIRSDDPSSAWGTTSWTKAYGRGNFRVRAETATRMTVTKDHFLITATVDAFEQGTRIFSTEWSAKIERDGV